MRPVRQLLFVLFITLMHGAVAQDFLVEIGLTDEEIRERLGFSPDTLIIRDKKPTPRRGGMTSSVETGEEAPPDSPEQGVVLEETVVITDRITEKKFNPD